MGMFDTFVGWSNCKHCGRLNRTNMQFKWLECIMTDYDVGSYVCGNEPYEIFDEDVNVCEECKKKYFVYAFGKEGHLLGFVNDTQLEKIKEFIDFKEEYGHTISSNEIDDDIDNFIKQHVCQIPDYVHNPYKRPNVGDVCYKYNKERKKYFDKTKVEDEKLIIIKREMCEEFYVYKVQKENGDILDYIHEIHLVNEEQKVGIEESIARTKETIKRYWELKTKDRTEKEERSFSLLKLMTHKVEPELIEKMKELGDIPPHFSFD